MTTTNCRENFCLFFRAAVFISLALVSVTLLFFYIFDMPLPSATCDITRVFPGDVIEVRVRPDGDAPFFTKVVDVPDTELPIRQGTTLHCYYEVDDGDTTVRFESGRRVYIIRVSLLSLWVGILFIVAIWYFWRHGCALSGFANAHEYSV